MDCLRRNNTADFTTYQRSLSPELLFENAMPPGFIDCRPIKREFSDQHFDSPDQSLRPLATPPLSWITPLGPACSSLRWETWDLMLNSYFKEHWGRSLGGLSKPAKRPKVALKFPLGMVDWQPQLWGTRNHGGTDCPLLDYQGLLRSAGELWMPPALISMKNWGKCERYQTVYAKENGPAAAPTAGLPISPKNCLHKLKPRKAVIYLTLHVGLGTFRPVCWQFTTTKCILNLLCLKSCRHPPWG